MISCAFVFMTWLAKFEHGNCCWKTGTFGWFMQDRDSPFGGWYEFDKNTAINFGDGRVYEKGDTNFFSVDKGPHEKSQQKKKLILVAVA